MNCSKSERVKSAAQLIFDMTSVLYSVHITQCTYELYTVMVYTVMDGVHSYAQMGNKFARVASDRPTLMLRARGTYVIRQMRTCLSISGLIWPVSNILT